MLRLLYISIVAGFLLPVHALFDDVYANEHYQIRHKRVRWQEQHPQIRTKQWQVSMSNVADVPKHDVEAAYSRLECHSCMSSYLQDQFVYISHLYRKPLSFTDKCDRQTFDWRHVKLKNCTDMCITLRINDKVGGRRRSGYIRGCLSDIKYYNRSVLFYGDVMRTAYNPQNTRCQMVRLRDLFAAPEWYGFDSSDHVELCTCHSQMCNSAPNRTLLGYLILLPALLLSISAFNQLFPTRRKDS